MRVNSGEVARGGSLQIRTDCFTNKEEKTKRKEEPRSPSALLFSSARERNRFHGVGSGREAAANVSMWSSPRETFFFCLLPSAC